MAVMKEKEACRKRLDGWVWFSSRRKEGATGENWGGRVASTANPRSGEGKARGSPKGSALNVCPHTKKKQGPGGNTSWYRDRHVGSIC